MATPLRRSKRARTTPKSLASSLDLTRSTPDANPDPDSDSSLEVVPVHTHKKPAKRVRKTKALPGGSAQKQGPAAAPGPEEDGEMDPDEAFARRLQDEEDHAAQEDQDMAGPSTSTFARRSTRKRRSSASTSLLVVSSSPAAAAVAQHDKAQDKDDPLVMLEGCKEALLGRKGVCGGCGAGVSVERETPQLTASTPLSTFLDSTATTCPACACTLCIGCWVAPGDNDPEGRAAGECCAVGRAIAVFELLSALDTVYLTEYLARPATSTAAAVSASSSGPIATTKKPRAVASTSKGKGKAVAAAAPSGSGAGTGYGSGTTFGAGVGAGTGYSVDEYGEDGYGDDDYWMDEVEAPEFEDHEAEDAFWDKQQEEHDKKVEEKRAARAAELAAKQALPANDLALDPLFLAALTHLSALLPQPDSPTAKIYDYLPDASLAPLLEASTLPDLLAQLLRNDSVVEWTRRADVYFAMLAVLEGLGACETTLGVVFGRRRDKAFSEGVARWMRGEGEIKWARTAGATGDEELGTAAMGARAGRATKRRKVKQVEEDGELSGQVVLATPLYTLLKKLTIQAEAFRRAATSGAFDDTDADAALVGICGDFATAGERFKALERVWSARQPVGDGVGENGGARSSPSRVRGAVNGKGKSKVREWTQDEYDKVCAELAYDNVELGTATSGSDGGKNFQTHHYKTEISAIDSSRRSHGSFVHIAKELAVLSTSLPPGIWVRVDESRIDVIKCLIAGPETSPYANGLFEFDTFLPLQYPQVSPKCWLRTTGGEKCRFNPNLYAEGKVCLSLLGTWSGAPEEMWVPHTSSILQVLLSITSMILGTNYPFYNEPGFGAPRDDLRNQNYNKNCSLATTRWAILDWIQGDKFKDSIWADVILSHFLLHRSSIESTLATWAALDPRLQAWTPSYNSTAGTQLLEPFKLPVYNHVPVAQPQPQVAAAAAAVGKAKAKSKAAAPSVAAPAAPAGPAPKDLVREVREALDGLSTWKEDVEGWLEGLVA
ncbi:hypothetical protein JCM9279_004724 [Rhodotorula babjevae]